MTKTPAIISATLTSIMLVIILMSFTVLGFVPMDALNNGANEIWALCQSVILILSTIFAGWLTNRLTRKFNWNKILSVVITVILGTLFGAIALFLSPIISIPLAGLR